MSDGAMGVEGYWRLEMGLIFIHRLQNRQKKDGLPQPRLDTLHLHIPLQSMLVNISNKSSDEMTDRALVHRSN